MERRGGGGREEGVGDKMRGLAGENSSSSRWDVTLLLYFPTTRVKLHL